MIVLKMTYIYWYHSQYDMESDLFHAPSSVLYKRKSEKIHGRIISVVGC